MKAQRSLNTCQLGHTTIIAEFVGEQEACQLLRHMTGPMVDAMNRNTSSSASSLASLWSTGQQAGMVSEAKLGVVGQQQAQWNGGAMGNSAWSMSGLWSGEDNHNPLLPGDLLGGQ